MSLRWISLYSCKFSVWQKVEKNLEGGELSTCTWFAMITLPLNMLSFPIPPLLQPWDSNSLQWAKAKLHQNWDVTSPSDSFTIGNKEIYSGHWMLGTCQVQHVLCFWTLCCSDLSMVDRSWPGISGDFALEHYWAFARKNICRCLEGVVSEQIWKWYQKVHELAKSLVRRAFKASAPIFEICLFWLWAAWTLC